MNKLSALCLTICLCFINNLQAEEAKQTFENKTLNANIVYADGKNFGEQVVLLLHGTLTHNGRSTYTELQQNLAKLGISSLSMNLSLGLDDRHGEYDCAVPHTHKHTDALKEIAVWQNFLKDKGVQKITLVGHSRGGNQIAWYASEHDKDPMIQKVVLIAPATGEQQSATEYQQKYGKPLAPILKQATNLTQSGKGDQLMKDVDFIYCDKTQVSAAAFVDYYTVKPQFDTPSLLKKIKKPTLVLVASEDQVVPELAQRLASVKGIKQLTIKTIDGADHFFMDLYNEDVASAIRDFMI
jgi:pimeloyl-ACP methyl ester carboxylesterase